MENQPRFDLNDALLRWWHDLAAQPGIAAEDVRELETHLLESFAAFQRGLTEEEALSKLGKSWARRPRWARSLPKPIG
jgi:hypothetical protein